MRNNRFNFGRQDSFTSLLLLLALLFRAYVPVGFMPASGTPFLLEPCPATYQTQMPTYHGHHHSNTHAHFENCPFGSTPGAGPIAHVIAVAPPPLIECHCSAAFDALHLSPQSGNAHQPRGPPSSPT